MTTMSPDLIAFLKDWYHWATNGAPDRQPFTREDGLCDNVWNCSSIDRACRWQVLGELTKAFGGNWYPFGEDDYQSRYDDDTQHECPKRLAWVRERLIEAGEIEA